MNLVSDDSSLHPLYGDSNSSAIMSSSLVSQAPEVSPLTLSSNELSSKCYSLSFLTSRRPHYQLKRGARRALFALKLWKPAHVNNDMNGYYSRSAHPLFNSSFYQQKQLTQLCSETLRMFVCARIFFFSPFHRYHHPHSSALL